MLMSGEDTRSGRKIDHQEGGKSVPMPVRAGGKGSCRNDVRGLSQSKRGPF